MGFLYWGWDRIVGLPQGSNRCKGPSSSGKEGNEGVVKESCSDVTPTLSRRPCQESFESKVQRSLREAQ